MKRNSFSSILCYTLFPLLFTACNKNDTPVDIPTEPTLTAVGAYLVNAGNWNENNGTIQWLDLTTETLGNDLFRTANGIGIGDPEHLCVYGTKRYIACTTSAKIEIVDEKGKRVKDPIQLTNEQGQPINPRYLTATDGYVYFTAQDGTLSRLDTLSLEITERLTLGGYPEALTYANGKLYINQSDYFANGSGKSVSVVSIATFKKEKEIAVKLNPYSQIVTAPDGDVYVVSNGNYAGSAWIPQEEWVYQTVQRINTSTHEVTELCNGTYMAISGEKMVVLYAEYSLPDTHKIFQYDLVTKKEEILPIDLSQFNSPTFVALHPTTGDIYIGDETYGSLGDLYIFTPSGAFKKKIETGISPRNIHFVTQ